ncbi:hypothetical protein EGW08_014635 [Elysia chlorotica]|uniref:Glycogen debranching enzyme n=1 Tax=Elysia chlorotica TaxID=188477 RepID=A0A433T7Q8_ELYCH|nr:hypothetical protein EGW08_014635 [Elysia chlorotica]
MPMLTQVRVFTLAHGENSQHKLFRLEKGWTLRFILGPSLMASNVRIFCNHPPDHDTKYKRSKYYEVPWHSTTGLSSDRTSLTAEVHLHLAGSYNFFFTVDGSDDPEKCNGSGYFLVDPTLHLGPEKEEISMDAIVCQSVITKLLGYFDEWLPRLQVASESGYNMVHFTPVQELGISNSAYSIRNQLHLSPVYTRPGSAKNYDLDDLENLMENLNNNLGLMGLSDLVYNHTSKDSPWVLEHPECGFNMDNSPHLRPAYILDRIFENFSLEVGNGRWEFDGVPRRINSEEHIGAIYNVLRHKVFPSFRLHEFYCVNIENLIKEFRNAIEQNNTPIYEGGATQISIIQDPQFRRFKSSIDMNLAVHLFNTDRHHLFGPGAFSREDRISKCCEALVREVAALNAVKERELHDHLNVALENFVANVRWRFVNPGGPRLGEVTPDEPLMHGYFAIPKSHEGGVNKEEQMSYEDGAHVMAVNGWVMSDDPLKNFAAPGRNVYLRRELIAWGDSVKLNYGASPDDCPYLWKHMEEYTRQSAKIFQGLRLDNCHSTPIHVAEHMLDVAREVRPDLYVIAELFTGSEQLDNLFMNRLGINSLIRESLTAWDSHEQGRLVYRFGGEPVGAFVQPRLKPLVPTMAHALFYDQTHDNESPIEKRSVYDLWPTGAMVAITNCAIGSNRGFDQLVPIHINVVTEKRLYPSWADKQNPERPFINDTFGITRGKRALNKLHYMLAREGYNQVFVDQVDANTVSITRHNPQTHESVVLVARTAFQHPHNPNDQGYIRPIGIQGHIDKILLEGRMRESPQFQYKRDSDYLNGLPNFFLDLKESVQPHASSMININTLPDGENNEIHFKNFTPGSVVVIKSSLPSPAKKAILEIRRGLGQFGYMMRSYSGKVVYHDESHENSNFRHIVAQLDLRDINHCLFRIDQEERDDGYGFGSYNIPHKGPFVYCGLRGMMSELSHIRPNNDLGHPMCGNLREGDWLADYIGARLKVHKSLNKLGLWFDSIFSHLKKVPRFLVPSYFDAIITGAYMVLFETAINQMSDFVKDSSTFTKALAMTSLQVVGYTPQARLPFLSPALKPQPRRAFNNISKQEEEATLSMSAGFPHFGSGYMRNWGRDTFISIRGLLILTGRHEEARHIILAFASTLRHGLIPNLLNEGIGARYNCRDAVWFWLIAIREYCLLVPDGYNILKDPVSRMYPRDDSEPHRPGQVDQALQDVMQEALSRHAEGVRFRERNAGYQIDDQMTDQGFNNQIGVDWLTGFVYGGTEWNCGTWMDKMGSSERAGNKGVPATPRDGSAVELVGMCAGVVKWLAEANANNHYPYNGVQTNLGKTISYQEWFELIKRSFEPHFFIPVKSVSPREANAELINRKGIYKDTLYASHKWMDYQLRPNFPVAMMACPELFTTENAMQALNVAGDVLMGPLGMKTLDPSDWNYRGDYNNNDDSTDRTVAKGFNYHQGPEWVWPVGYFLRAKLLFAGKMEASKKGTLEKTKLYINSVLCKHYQEILANPWQGLPELTNSNGQFCHGSCQSQAWSSATILETLYDMSLTEDGNTD